MTEFRKKYYVLFLPVSFLYGVIINIRNFLFDKKIIKSYKFNFPIISVGNITVGGTGKTPHVEYIVDFLKDKYKTLVLTRGYKRKTSGFVLAQDNSTVTEIGDEPKQIKNKFGDKVVVAIDKDRINAIENLKNKQIKFDIIILDDAFQYRKIKPDCSILLVDYYRPINKDRLLPAGDLRERASNKNRADIVVVTKCPVDITPIQKRLFTKELKLFSFQKIFFTSFDYSKPVNIFNKEQLSQEINSNTTIFLVTGIANPLPIEKYLNTKTKNIIHKKYPDHYNFKHNDIMEIISEFDAIEAENKIIITTEKDAMRLQEFNYDTEKGNLSKKPIFYIPINIIFVDNKKQEFNNTIINYVELNKRNS